MEKLYQSEKQNRILEICNEVVLRLSDPQYVHCLINMILMWAKEESSYLVDKNKELV